MIDVTLSTARGLVAPALREAFSGMGLRSSVGEPGEVYVNLSHIPGARRDVEANVLRHLDQAKRVGLFVQVQTIASLNGPGVLDPNSENFGIRPYLADRYVASKLYAEKVLIREEREFPLVFVYLPAVLIAGGGWRAVLDAVGEGKVALPRSRNLRAPYPWCDADDIAQLVRALLRRGVRQHITRITLLNCGDAGEASFFDLAGGLGGVREPRLVWETPARYVFENSVMYTSPLRERLTKPRVMSALSTAVDLPRFIRGISRLGLIRQSRLPLLKAMWRPS